MHYKDKTKCTGLRTSTLQRAAPFSRARSFFYGEFIWRQKRAAQDDRPPPHQDAPAAAAGTRVGRTRLGLDSAVRTYGQRRQELAQARRPSGPPPAGTSARESLAACRERVRAQLPWLRCVAAVVVKGRGGLSRQIKRHRSYPTTQRRPHLVQRADELRAVEVRLVMCGRSSAPSSLHLSASLYHTVPCYT